MPRDAGQVNSNLPEASIQGASRVLSLLIAGGSDLTFAEVDA